MKLHQILQNQRLWIMESIFTGAILSAILFGIIGYLVGLDSFATQPRVGDIRAGEMATFYSLIGVFLGCISGVFLGPLTLFLAARVYLRNREKNDQI